MRLQTRAVAVLLTTLVAPQLGPGLAAQSPTSLPAVGTHAVTFSLPDGGGAGFGIRKMRSATTNVGVEIQFGVSRRWVDSGDNNEFPPDGGTSWLVGLRPDVRLYRRTEGPVLPFLEWNGHLGYQGASGGRWVVDGSVGAGLGVEWFPLQGMSLSGSTGLAGTYTGADSGAHSLAVGMFRSELILNLYF